MIVSLPDEFHLDRRIFKRIKRAVIWPTSPQISCRGITVGFVIGVGAAKNIFAPTVTTTYHATASLFGAFRASAACTYGCCWQPPIDI